jgi:hypothetical protein
MGVVGAGSGNTCRMYIGLGTLILIIILLILIF